MVLEFKVAHKMPERSFPSLKIDGAQDAKRPPRTLEHWNLRTLEPAFTLIELLIVITLIVVLAGIGLATYSTSVKRAKEAVLKEDLFRMRDAIDQHFADKTQYPADLATLVSAGYLRQIPEDPFTESADTWQTILSEPDPANPSAQPGVYDVKSAAEGVALDGTNYADW